MNNLKIINTNKSINKETDILNSKYAKSVYKSPVLYQLGSLIKKTTGSGGSDLDAFTLTPYTKP